MCFLSPLLFGILELDVRINLLKGNEWGEIQKYLDIPCPKPYGEYFEPIYIIFSTSRAGWYALQICGANVLGPHPDRDPADKRREIGQIRIIQDEQEAYYISEWIWAVIRLVIAYVIWI